MDLDPSPLENATIRPTQSLLEVYIVVELHPPIIVRPSALNSRKRKQFACPFRLPAEMIIPSANCRRLQAGTLRSPRLAQASPLRPSRVLASPAQTFGVFRKQSLQKSPRSRGRDIANTQTRALPKQRRADSKSPGLTATLTIHDMKCAFLHRHRGFFHRFAQGRMRVTGPAKILAAAAEFDHRGWFGD
jgi:hypothetical protein